MMKDFARAMAPLKNRVMMMIARGLVKLVSDDGPVQLMQVRFLANEVRENAEHMQNFGFSSNPMPGAQCVAAFVGGNRDHPIVLLAEDGARRYRGLEPGESVHFNAVESCFILLKNDGSILVKSPVGITVDAPFLHCTGDIMDQSTGDGKTMQEMRTVYNSHTHGENNADGGQTAVPSQQI